MMALHFMRNREVTPLYFNHGTKFGDKCEEFLKDIPNLKIGHLSRQLKRGESKENFWREERYKFFDQFTDAPVVTCHHLNDVIETMVQSLSHGKVRGIPHKRGNYIRPFLLVSKDEIREYVKRHKVSYLDDPSNDDISFTRNRVRHNVVPELLKINPGLYKSARKFVMDSIGGLKVNG